MTELWQWLKQGKAFAPAALTCAALLVLGLLMPLPARDTGTRALGGATQDGAAGAAGGAQAGGPGAVAGQPLAGGLPSTGPTVGPVATTGPGVGVGSDGGGGGSAAGATYQGVTATTVKMGTAAATKGCGGFDQTAVQQAYGISTNDVLSYQVATEYFNKYPLVDFPLPAEIRAHVNPKNGYWGRHITTVFKDSGGYACQDVGRANAVELAEKDKVFGLIMPNTDGPEVPMSLVMAQHHLIHIGRWLTGPLFWKERAPYFFDGVHGDGVEQNIALGSWVCRDWVGRKAHDTGDVKVSGLPRKFGILFPDDPQFVEVAQVLAAETKRCGLNAKQYAIPFDLSTLEAQVQATVNRMITDGVTTILSVNDFLTRLLSSTSATNQGWHPEWVLSGWGIGSYPGAYNTFMDPTQAPNAWAAADAASSVTAAWNKSEAYLAWKKVMPDQEPPDGWNNFYGQFKLLALGLAGAGPNLNPTTFGEGLGKLCDPCPRKSNKEPLLRIFPGHWCNREGFTLVHWNPNKPDYVDKPDSNGQPKAGYFDFLEGGKRYGLRITDPDPWRPT